MTVMKKPVSVQSMLADNFVDISSEMNKGDKVWKSTMFHIKEQNN